MSYSENLFRSIDEILKQRLNEIQFDKTVLCTIVSQDEDDKTKYWVTDGSLRFEAFSDSNNEEYANKSQVYVLVPEGNYEKRKIILGKYTDDKEDKVYQQATENIQLKAFDDFVSAYTLVELGLKSIKDLTNEYYSSDLDLSFHGLGGFTQLGVKFSIDSFSIFQGKETSEYSGSYGLKFDFKNTNNEILYTTVLDSSQIYGNPYMLTHNQIFEFVLPFDDSINPYDIKKFTIDFYYRDNNELAEISISNFKLYLGYSSEDIRTKLNSLKETKGLVVFLPSGSELKYPLRQEEETIYVNWIVEENGKYNIYNITQDLDHNKYEIAWGQYEHGYQGGGQNGENEKIPTLIESALGVYYKDITNNNTWIKDFENNMFDSKQPTTSFKFSVLQINKNKDDNSIESYTSITSNPFYFTNEDLKAEAGASSGAGDSLILQLDAGDDGRYNIYGNDNKIITNLGGNKIITAKFVQDDLNNSGSALKLSTVTWKIPKAGTQLAPIRVYDENTNSYILAAKWDGDTDNKYYIYTPNIMEDKRSEQLQELNLTYSFNSIYNPGNTNNKIICEVTGNINTTSEDGENISVTQKFIGSMDVYFGMAGTSGTDFNFYITADKENIKASDSVIFTAHLETLDGKEVIDSESILNEVEWLWGANAGTGKTFEYQLSIPKASNTLFIGDSYATSYLTEDGEWKSPGWPERVFETDEVFVKALGGSGFAKIDEKNLSFKELLEEFVSEHDSKEIEQINYVVVGGGYNDYAASEEAIKDGIEAFETYLYENFEELNDYYIYMLGQHKTEVSINNSLNNVRKIYTEQSSGSVKDLRHLWDAYGSDGIHPSNTGVDQIADAIWQSFYIDNYQTRNPVLAQVNFSTVIRTNAIQLKAYYIPTINLYGNSIKNLTGPFSIVYDEQGLNPSFDTRPYCFDHEIELDSLTLRSSNLNDSVDLLNYGDNINGYLYEFSPFISSIEPEFFFLEAIKGKEVWRRPIFISRNSYASKLLNTWDGLTQVNYKDNYILSQMIGAGTKDAENKFTGVLMGQVGRAFDSAKHGLYGFKNGAEIFSLKENGSFYVGTGNTNYISFNENVEGRGGKNKLSIKVDGFQLISGNFTLGTEQLGAITLNQNDGLAINAPRITIKGPKYQSYLELQSHFFTIEPVFTYEDEEGKMRPTYGNKYDNGIKIYQSAFTIYSTENPEQNYHFNPVTRNIPVFRTFDDYQPVYIAGGISNIMPNNYEQIPAMSFEVGRSIATLDNTSEYGVPCASFNFRTYKPSTEREDTAVNTTLDILLIRPYYSQDDLNGIKCCQYESVDLIGRNNFYIGLSLSDDPQHYENCISLTSEALGESHLSSYLKLTSTLIHLWPTSLGRLKHYWSADYTITIDSDRRLKNNITTLSKQYDIFFDNLIPTSFCYNSEQTNQKHIGFIAQDIQTSMQKANFIQNELSICSKTDREDYLGLRYEEFIALNTWQIQMLKSRVAELEKEIKEIKQNEI